MSLANTSTTPLSISPSSRVNPSRSIASVTQSRTVSKTSGWSGTSMSAVGALSWHCTCAGNTDAKRSSDLIRTNGAGTFFPPENLIIAKARVAFQRHLVWNRGACNAACVKTFSTFLVVR